VLTPREGSPALARRLTIQPTGRNVLVFGADSPHTAEEPFVIRRSQIRSPLDVVDVMKDIACRAWGATPADLLALAELLLVGLDDRRPAS
jgi:hypothetical protein